MKNIIDLCNENLNIKTVCKAYVAYIVIISSIFTIGKIIVT